MATTSDRQKNNSVPVIFIHGLGCASSVDYRGIDLGGRQRILVDLPGSGVNVDVACDFSMIGLARHIEQDLRRQDVSHAVLFGHSMGGAVAMSLTQMWPELVAGVILTESNLDPGGGMWSRRIASFSEADFVKTGWDELIAEQRRECPTWARTVDQSSPVALHREAVSLIAGTSPTWRETLYNLPCSRFFVFGDRNLPDDDYEELPRHGVQVLTVPNAGHNMVYDNPAGFAQVVAQCLSQVAE